MRMIAIAMAMLGLVIVANGPAMADQVGWDLWSHDAVCHAPGFYIAGMSLEVDGCDLYECSAEFGCGASTLDGLALMGATLSFVYGGYGLAGIEQTVIEIIERDPALSASFQSMGGDSQPAVSQVVGPNTLTLDGMVAGSISCGDCSVVRITYIGDNIVANQSASWSTLKSNY